MRFFLDHDVPEEVAHLLRYEGHFVTVLRDALPLTTPDTEAFGYAVSNELLTITCNRNDFLELARSRGHPGLIIMIRRRTRQAECGRLLALLRRAGEAGLSGNINFA